MADNFKLYGDIFRASVFGANVYVVSDPNFVQHVLRNNWTNYRKGRDIKRVALLLGRGIMVSEGDFWIKQRRMIQPSSHWRVIEGFYDIMRSANDKLLAKWKKAADDGEAVNVTSDVSVMVLEVTLRTIFGADYPQAASFFNVLHDIVARNLGFAQDFKDTRQIVTDIVARRRKDQEKHADILGILLEGRDQTGDPMPDEQVVTEIVTLVVAGHETTVSTLNFLWYSLSHNTAAEEELATEIYTLADHRFPTLQDLSRFIFTSAVIEETLRLYPAGWLLTRRAINEDFLGVYLVPAGTEIYISPYIIQRHPRFWANPDAFDPSRFLHSKGRETRAAETLPFSIGPRNCVGEHFARTEMKVHLITVAGHLRLRCLSQEPLELEAGVNLRAKHDFLMAPEIRA